MSKLFLIAVLLFSPILTLANGQQEAPAKANPAPIQLYPLTGSQISLILTAINIVLDNTDFNCSLDYTNIEAAKLDLQSLLDSANYQIYATEQDLLGQKQATIWLVLSDAKGSNRYTISITLPSKEAKFTITAETETLVNVDLGNNKSQSVYKQIKFGSCQAKN